jgi:hypothetical protein
MPPSPNAEQASAVSWCWDRATPTNGGSRNEDGGRLTGLTPLDPAPRLREWKE